MALSEPDYLICVECDSPCYLFEWDANNGKPSEAFCKVCGNDDPALFATEEQLCSGE